MCVVGVGVVVVVIVCGMVVDVAYFAVVIDGIVGSGIFFGKFNNKFFEFLILFNQLHHSCHYI